MQFKASIMRAVKSLFEVQKFQIIFTVDIIYCTGVAFHRQLRVV